MTTAQTLYRVYRRLPMAIPEARFYTKKVMDCKRRIDEKYSVNESENPFFLSEEQA